MLLRLPGKARKSVETRNSASAYITPIRYNVIHMYKMFSYYIHFGGYFCDIMTMLITEIEQFEHESKYACEIVLNTGKPTANNLQVYVIVYVYRRIVQLANRSAVFILLRPLKDLSTEQLVTR